MSLRVAIFDDVIAARGEAFSIPGLAVEVYPHADDADVLCTEGERPDVVFMDFEMGAERQSGAEAVAKLRAAGFSGRIIAISSDPAANQAMRAAGADDALDKKAHLRSYLVHLAATVPA
jgi:CheY-like chemotaxis protein